jgi:hypothetical protein
MAGPAEHRTPSSEWREFLAAEHGKTLGGPRVVSTTSKTLPPNNPPNTMHVTASGGRRGCGASPSPGRTHPPLDELCLDRLSASVAGRRTDHHCPTAGSCASRGFAAAAPTPVHGQRSNRIAHTHRCGPRRGFPHQCTALVGLALVGLAIDVSRWYRGRMRPVADTTGRPAATATVEIGPVTVGKEP